MNITPEIHLILWGADDQLDDVVVPNSQAHLNELATIFLNHVKDRGGRVELSVTFRGGLDAPPTIKLGTLAFGIPKGCRKERPILASNGRDPWTEAQVASKGESQCSPSSPSSP